MRVRDKEEEKRSRVIDELCHKIVVFFSIDRGYDNDELRLNWKRGVDSVSVSFLA